MISYFIIIGIILIFYIIFLYNNNTIIFYFFHAGKAGKGKVKNPKKSQPDQPSQPVKDKFKIPKKNTLLHTDSEDDEIGQNPASTEYCDNKFSCNASGLVNDMFKPEELLSSELSSLCEDFSKLVLYSVSSQTWARHCSAWKLYHEFCRNFGISNKLPVSIKNARGFVTWAVTSRKLKSATVRSYILSLNVAHQLSSFDEKNLNSDPCIKMALKGAKNYSDLTATCKKDRLPMSIDLLKILGHRLSRLNWSDFSKQVMWAACTTSFFTSCRMGEILSPQEKKFDSSSTLLWGNVKFLENNEILILIPYSKTTGFKGKLLDIFPLEDKTLCPASALRRLKKLCISNGTFCENKPVFAFKSGKFLTKAMLNSWLAEILKDFVDKSHRITGHSFRSAIPTALSSHPNEQSAAVIKDWGGWVSSSYNCYTKDERDKRKYLFSRITDCLFKISY